MRYASIQIVSTKAGTVTDELGNYLLESVSMTDSLRFSYLGYESQTISCDVLKDEPTVVLAPSLVLGPEVVIRPLDAETYLKKVIRSFPQNYPTKPYELYSYYTERVTEDGRLLDHAEAGFYSQINESNKNRYHQLILYHQADLSELEFMRKTAEKKKAKYLKKHPEDTEAAESNSLIQTDFGGPDLLLDMGVTSGNIHPLDSTNFKDFRYSYGLNSSFMGHAVINIAYSSRGKDDHMRKEGLIYIDNDSDAIVAIIETGKLVIPAVIKPILFAMGLSISNPTYNMDLRYRPYEGQWYMEQMHWDVEFGMKKRYLFKENEKSRFFIAQTMLGREINSGWNLKISPEHLFDKEKDMKDQVAPIEEIGWDQIR
jgi:hypothetical protein